MELSLSRFFERTADAALDTCDMEQIHLCGMVQDGTGLIVLDAKDGKIIGASENIHGFIDMPAEAILGYPLEQVLPDIAEQIAELEDSTRINHEILDAQVERGGAIHDVVTHTHGGKRFVEFILNDTPSASAVRKRMRRGGSACSQIIGADTFDAAMQIAADAVRDLTGFDRVKIYRFMPDWSGATVAESRNDQMVSMLGMHFPQSDIPKQVRELMAIIPYRFIGSVNDANIPIRALGANAGSLDMTWTMGRAASAMHTAYLRNIGAQSAFSCSLIDKAKLWGLIACHHSKAQIVPSDSWLLAQEIGTALMLRYDQTQRTETAEMISQLRRIECEFAAELRRSGDVEDVVKTLVPILQKFLRADGFAFQYGLKLHTSGETPPNDFIRDLIQWTQKEFGGSDQYKTVSLQSDYPKAAPYNDVACGVLVQPIVVHRVCQLIWFRGPITRRVKWAGRPDTKLTTDPKTGATLGPRSSFETWIEEHSDQSLPWEEAELQAAREIFQEFLDIISSQLLLKEENASLRHFAHMAAHDIKSPLRGISAALEWMEEDETDQESLREHRRLATQQAQKLQRLTQSLLEMSLLREQAPELREVSLEDAVNEACDLIQSEISQSGALVTASLLPVCRGDPDLLMRIFLNLIGNAIKYATSEDRLQVDIYAVEEEQCHRIFVQDNGPGIPAKHAETIFEPSKRLVHGDDVEGCGFGLSICAQIAKLHDGQVYLDTSCQQGARFVFELPKVAG